MMLTARVNVTGRVRVDFGGVWSGVGLHARGKGGVAALSEEKTACSGDQFGVGEALRAMISGNTAVSSCPHQSSSRTCGSRMASVNIVLKDKNTCAERHQ